MRRFKRKTVQLVEDILGDGPAGSTATSYSPKSGCSSNPFDEFCSTEQPSPSGSTQISHPAFHPITLSLSNSNQQSVFDSECQHFLQSNKDL
jgi:hypothetical protein